MQMLCSYSIMIFNKQISITYVSAQSLMNSGLKNTSYIAQPIKSTYQ